MTALRRSRGPESAARGAPPPRQRIEALARCPRRWLDRLCAGRPGYQEWCRRRREPRHRSRRGLCVGIWSCAGLLAAAQPTLQIVIVSALAATFLSFAVLDPD